MDLTPAHQLAASRLFLTQEDVDDIIELVNSIKSEFPIVIDLGAGSGTTALAVLQTKPECEVFTVDNNEENIGWAAKNLMAFNIDVENWGFSKEEASDSSRHFKDSEVDLWLHDADHSEDQIRKDIKAWWSKFKIGTLIWVHDYLPMVGAAETYPGVKKVCDELVGQGLLEQIPTRGIGFAARVL